MTDTKLKRVVVIKMLPEVFATDPGRLACVQRGAKAVVALNHPNITATYPSKL